MYRNNEAVRNAIKEAGIRYWQAAEAVGVSYNTLSRWLRHEMSAEKQQEVIMAISAIRKETE